MCVCVSRFESFIYLTNIFSDSVAYLFSFNLFWWTEILNFNIVIVSTFLLLIFFCYCCFLLKTSLPDPVSCLRHLCLTQFDEDILYYFLLDVWDSFISSSSSFFFFFFKFLAALHVMQDLSSPGQGLNLCPLKWKPLDHQGSPSLIS